MTLFKSLTKKKDGPEHYQLKDESYEVITLNVEEFIQIQETYKKR